jgi:regulator of CtrA degradation
MRCIQKPLRILTLFRVTSCGFHAKLGSKNASKTILSLQCAALKHSIRFRLQVGTVFGNRVSGTGKESDGMKGWFKGEFMAYKPGGMEPQKANALTFAGSELFKRTFEEGMSMVEETATYLDGKGRAESKLLPSKAALTYAGESMRLTTRLMQMASWLLLQRAVNEGEMSLAQAGTDKHKVKLTRQDSVTDGSLYQRLPTRLKDLVQQSMRLQDRVIHLDLLLYARPLANAPMAPMPLETQYAQLRQAFTEPSR